MSFNSILNENIGEEAREYYSYFDMMSIGKIIASLIQIYEGKNYSYQEAYCYPDSKSYMGPNFVYSAIIIEEESKCGNYPNNCIEELLSQDKAIVLVKDISPIDYDMNFYRKNEYGRLIECVKYGKFSYVKEFIDSVIEYRIKNQKRNISFEELEVLKLKFITSRLDKIKENYKIRDIEHEKLVNKLEKDKENRHKQLVRIMNISVE